MNGQSDIRSIHFIGISGTAMAAAAVELKNRGYTISGSDLNTYPPMSTFLAQNGIAATNGFSENNLEPRPGLVVIGNAVSRGNPEVEYILDNKLPFLSLPELIKEFFLRDKKAIVVTGTHGKTTTASLIAWTLEHNGLNPGFLIGGIPRNFDKGVAFTPSDWFVIEGDEYDSAFFDKRSKFIHYIPEIAIINNIEFDHADIFEDLDAVRKSFRQFINIIPRNALLITNGDSPNISGLLDTAPCRTTGFSLTKDAEYAITGIQASETHSNFKLNGDAYSVPLNGAFNIQNAAAAAICAYHAGLDHHQIQSAFATFKGVKRRMEDRGIFGGVGIIDDFAHHPTAVRQTLEALKTRFPGRRIWAVFEPRSNTTRRNIFQKELTAALSLADAVIIAQVNRIDQLQASERLDPQQIIDDLVKSRVSAFHLPTTESIAHRLLNSTRPGDIVCILSNGGFGGLHEMLIKQLQSK
ncbi:MAG: UDP-N-acetylmuramate:L-alanyl-gamma-D-glutamyl-meso-diaminopimelate ligase [Verrucomicrobia bacterium]|nr:UDP-N-acetylmuramate:L-alanyl-gamma-D-glutamyl-meso-diaminopimelate ligase [Verrucomicrobiota bacterium]